MAIICNASDIHLRSSQAMGLSALTPFSVVAWINATWNSGSRRSFVGIYGPTTDTPLGAPATAIQIGTTNGGGELSFWTWGGLVLTGTGAGVMTPYNGLWVCTAYTFDGTTHRGYLNGVQVSTSTTAQQPGFLNQVYINGYPGGGTNEVHNHQVDTYSLFRRALSADEVLTIYNARGDRHGIIDDVICSYSFDEGVQAASATSIVDLSGNGHTLTSTGAGSAITYTYSNNVANSNIRPVQ